MDDDSRNVAAGCARTNAGNPAPAAASEAAEAV
jgi:hypothetical protein